MERSTEGLRGRKGTLYEGGIRVPGIIEWPEVIKKNQESSYPVTSTDFLPTVADVLGKEEGKGEAHCIKQVRSTMWHKRQRNVIYLGEPVGLFFTALIDCYMFRNFTLIVVC